MFPRDILSRSINLYNYYLSLTECFLFIIYFLIIKFFVTSESIIMISIFLLIMILIFKYIIFIDTIIPFAEAISQYFFWLLLSEEFSSFLILFPKNLFVEYTEDHLDKNLYIFSDHNRFRTYLLYIIVIIFIYSVLLYNFILKVFLIICLKIEFF